MIRLLRWIRVNLFKNVGKIVYNINLNILFLCRDNMKLRTKGVQKYG